MKKKPVEKRFIYPGSLGMENQVMPMILTDPFGSYTGITEDPDERPVQDADDL